MQMSIGVTLQPQPRSAAAWDPADIGSAMTGRWRADSYGSADGVEVSTAWTNTGSAGATFNWGLPSAGRRPLLRSTGGPNGTAALENDSTSGGGAGTSRFFLTTAVDQRSLVAAQAAHVFIVCRHGGTGTQTVIWTGRDSGANDRMMCYAPYDGVLYWDFKDATGGSGRVNAASDIRSSPRWGVLELLRDGADQYAKYAGSTVVSSSSQTSVTLASGTATMILFGAAAAGDLAWDGKIAEMIVCNRKLTAGELTGMAQYMLARYGLSM